MSGKHTPGPWQSRNLNGQWRVEGIIDSRQIHIASVFGGVNTGFASDNACLIAATLDLLNALQTLSTAATTVNNLTHASLTEGPEVNEALSDLYQATNAARAAIAKATGE